MTHKLFDLVTGPVSTSVNRIDASVATRPRSSPAGCSEPRRAAESSPSRRAATGSRSGRRFKRDKVAIGGVGFIIFLFLICFVGGAGVRGASSGTGRTTSSTAGLRTRARSLPSGPGRISTTCPYIGATGHFPSAAVPARQRRQPRAAISFLRLLYGGQASLEVAIFATVFSMAHRRADRLDRRLLRRLASTRSSRASPRWSWLPGPALHHRARLVVGPQLNGITFGFLGRGVFMITIVFSRSSAGSIRPGSSRGMVLSLREKEFIEAARMVGASDARIMRSHLLPHLVAPIIVYSPRSRRPRTSSARRACRSSASASSSPRRVGGTSSRRRRNYYLVQCRG